MDPRPAEHFARFHERARTRKPDWVYGVVRLLTTTYGIVAFRARGIASGSHPARGAPDPGARTTSRSWTTSSSGCSPGARSSSWRSRSSSSARCSGSTRTAACFRCAAATTTRRRSSPPSRSSRAAAAWSCTARAGARAPVSSPRTSAARHRQARAAIGREVVPVAIHGSAAGAQLEAPAVPAGHRALRRAHAFRERARSEPRPPAGGRRSDLRRDQGALRGGRRPRRDAAQASAAARRASGR